MTAQEVGLAALAAVLLFWGVGAYNRLVRLRTEVGRAFSALATQLLQRDGLLLRWGEAMAAFLEHDASADGELRDACEQLRRAVERAGSRPHVAGLIDELRAADAAVAAARSAVAAELAFDAHHLSAVGAGLGAEVKRVGAELDSCDAALGFAREEFNRRVVAYNHALMQFPTVLITGMFGFRAGAEL